MHASSIFDREIGCAAIKALAVTLFVIPALQLDIIAQVVFPADRLRDKRRVKALYRLQSGIRLSLKNQCERVLRNNGIQSKNCNDNVLFLNDKDEMKKLASDLLKKEEYPEILGLEVQDETKEILLFLSLEKGGKMVQVPLTQFCLMLADIFEGVLTSTTLCFVADASGGLGPRLFHKVLTGIDLGVAQVIEPSWMTALASLINQRLISREQNQQKIIFALCRLEAWRVRKEVGASRTVSIYLPGQSSTSTLLPLLQSTFPCERHVFAYDGCISSVSRASATFSPSNTSTPITPLQLPQRHLFNTKLAQLSSIHANAVEAWMSSVSSFLALKEDEKNNEYLPFVCRLGFIMGNTDGIGDLSEDSSELALINVLQHITGSRSRPLKEDTIKSATAILKNFIKSEKGTNYPVLSDKQRLAIEDCVFCHKGILIGDKTLLDTVQPKVEWSLKATKKLTGCSCCAPEEEEEEEEENEGQGMEKNKDEIWTRTNFARVDSSSQTVTPKKKRDQPRFVDGKMGFAFDPNQFTGGTMLQVE